MSAISIRIMVLSLVGVVSLNGTARAANAEPMDLPPETMAKIAKLKAKTLSQFGGRQNSAANPDGTDCGSVQIGNVVTGGRPGSAPKDNTVVIFGDVFNANNKCR